ncbi:MAG: glycosyltransferase [Candidatus Staskawiczbacteria bacterium]|jgi:glycosyltransferase involved in cell wall biosynthesis
MNSKKVSVIIPARNEEEFIQKTIENYRSQDYPVEIVVVVNNSQDKTYEIAKGKANKTLNFPDKIGVSAARNEGAKVATGDIFIFSDADSYFGKNAVKNIAEQLGENTIGSPLGRQDGKGFKGWLFFAFKNWTHRLKIYDGVIDGILFCHKDIFFKAGGFDKNKKIGEFADFISRAKLAGAKYKLFTNCYGTTSLRRYQKNGYLNSFIFWIKWKVTSILKKEQKLTEKYFDDK